MSCNEAITIRDLYMSEFEEFENYMREGLIYEGDKLIGEVEARTSILNITEWTAFVDVPGEERMRPIRSFDREALLDEIRDLRAQAR